MARLNSIRIAGWKSIQNIEPKLELGPINVLIGANGSGKSNFISFFRMMSALVDERFQAHIGQWGFANSFLHFGLKVTQRVEAELEFEIGADHYRYAVHLTWAAPDNLLFAEEQIDFQSPDLPSLTLNLIDSSPIRESGLRRQTSGSQADQVAQEIRQVLCRYREFHFNDTSASARIRIPGKIEANHYLESNGGNLAALLYLYKQRKPAAYRHIVATARKIMPMFDDFILDSRLNPQYAALRWRQQGNEYLFEPHQFSDGTLRALALITLFLQSDEDLPPLIIVDEPELGLHPHAIEIICGLIRAASLKTQVILTTQSTTFLDHFAPEEIVVVDSEDGRSVLRHLKAEDLKDWLEDYSMGELWEKNVLGGGPLP